MNGRVYDYNLGRFMSVDPVIQSPTNSQSINPYSYIMNNPLSGTDPTGYASCSVEDPASCEEVAESLGKEEKANITQKQSVTGSRIKRDVKVGTMTGNGNGTVNIQIGNMSATADIGAPSTTAKGNNSTSGGALSGAAVALPLAAEGISGETILSALGRALTTVALSLSTPGSTPEAVHPLIPAESLTENETLERVRQGAINIDTGTARALSGPASPIQGEILAAMGNNARLMTQTALGEFVVAVRRNGRPDVIANASAFLSTVSAIPDMPSIRVMNLLPTRTIKMPDQRIFGTGDRLGIRTITSDQRFVRAAANQGVVLDSYIHSPHSF